MIVSAAATVAPPANTAKRAKHAFSSSPSRSWLQSIVARSVCWRAGASRAPRGQRGERRSRRSAISRGESSPQRAAASSIASGSPSRRRQMLATAAAFVVVELEVGVVSACALAEQRDRVDAGQRRRVIGAAGLRQRERRHGVALLGLQAERFAAGGEHRAAPGRPPAAGR